MGRHTPPHEPDVRLIILSLCFCDILRRYQRALQVLNDRFSNVEHALQVFFRARFHQPRRYFFIFYLLLFKWLTALCVQVRCDQQIRAAVAVVRRTICDVQIKEEVVVKKVKKDEALANYKLQMANLLQTESRIRRLFRDVDQVFQKRIKSPRV